MVVSAQLRRWSSSSIIFRRWVTGTPPCDPNLSQLLGITARFTSREASAAGRLRPNAVAGQVGSGAHLYACHAFTSMLGADLFLGLYVQLVARGEMKVVTIRRGRRPSVLVRDHRRECRGEAKSNRLKRGTRFPVHYRF